MDNAFTVLRNRLRIDPAIHRDALDALARGKRSWLVVSGKMTAGKDTVAPELVDLIGGDVAMLRYGNLMRAELDPALDLMRSWYDGVTDVADLGTVDADRVAADVAALLDLPTQHAKVLVDTLAPELVASGGTLTAHARTNGVRVILQNLGDAWRCADDPDYWARAAAIASLAAVGAGQSVILTGGRYLPDVEIPRAAGAMLVRLDVTRDTQLARLRSRDGLDPDADTLAALDHPGETALDDWPHFDVRVDNDGDLAECIARVHELVFANLARRATRVA